MLSKHTVLTCLIYKHEKISTYPWLCKNYDSRKCSCSFASGFDINCLLNNMCCSFAQSCEMQRPCWIFTVYLSVCGFRFRIWSVNVHFLLFCDGHISFYSNLCNLCNFKFCFQCYDEILTKPKFWELKKFLNESFHAFSILG